MKYKCKNCGYEYDALKERDYRRASVFDRIIKQLKIGQSSIAQLSRSLNINRTTLNYYLNLLKKDNKICGKRLLNLNGRPTIIMLK